MNVLDNGDNYDNYDDNTESFDLPEKDDKEVKIKKEDLAEDDEGDNNHGIAVAHSISYFFPNISNLLCFLPVLFAFSKSSGFF